MKMKNLMTMTMAAMAFVLGMSSCSSSNDDASEAAVASQVVGTYAGNEIVMVNNEESSNEAKTYEFTKATDTSIDMTIPEVGMGMMTIPALPIKDISLKKEGNTIKGTLTKYEGTLKGTDGTDKAYTVNNITILFSDKTIVATFTTKYGKMPFNLETVFTGTKK